VGPRGLVELTSADSGPQADGIHRMDIDGRHRDPKVCP